jgi:ATP-dependent helicase/nuclease subunit A
LAGATTIGRNLEDQLVEMLAKRDRWMHDFVLTHSPDWEALRERLERPFANAVRDALTEASEFWIKSPARPRRLCDLARFACSNPNGEQHRAPRRAGRVPLRRRSQPRVALEEAHQALLCLTNLLLTSAARSAKRSTRTSAFLPTASPEKARFLKLISDLSAVPGLEAALDRCSQPSAPPLHRRRLAHRPRLLHTASPSFAAQLKVVFAEAAEVDFIEVAQIAESVLKSDDGFPTDAALAVADGIRHLLVDEFQDTSRRQHQLLAGLIAAWPDRTGRTLFAVGDPMQSIYFFRDADAELFARVRENGLEIPNAEPLPLDFVSLSANFRTTPPLVVRLNEVFHPGFAVHDGSGVTFSPAEPARGHKPISDNFFELHINFRPKMKIQNS